MSNSILERGNEMEEALEDVMNGLTEQREERWRAGCKAEKEGIKEGILKLAADGNGGFITLSYLRSRYADRNHEFYIAYCDSDFPEEEKGAGQESVSVAGFMDGIDEDVDRLKKEAAEGFEQVEEGEKEYLYDWYMENIYEKFADVVEEIINSIRKESGTEVYYGEHLGEQIFMGCI